jgi:hypothetical protein
MGKTIGGDYVAAGRKTDKGFIQTFIQAGASQFLAGCFRAIRIGAEK